MISAALQENLLPSGQVMKIFGYESRAGFWQAVRAAGIPYIKINARRMMFEPSAVSAWLERRRVGGVRK